METIEVHVEQDHVESLSRVRNPLVAVEELVWNALDADATQVAIHPELDKLGGLVRIKVRDNGKGIPLRECESAFGSLGGSPKAWIDVTERGRIPHGKLGKGRFKAFGIGRTVTWTSRYQSDGEVREFEIKGFRSTLTQFTIGDERKADGVETGVEVVIDAIDDKFPSLVDPEAAAGELARRLALYLNQYPDAEVRYDDVLVDPTVAEDHRETYEVTLHDEDGNEVDGELTVIEWKTTTDRALYFCNEAGSALEQCPPGIKAPGFNFTAYLKSSLIPPLVDSGAFAADRMNPVVRGLQDTAKDALRTHFRRREAHRAVDLVNRWREEQVYPYDTADSDPIKTAEREVFDVCAVKVHEYVPDFEKSAAKSKRLTFRLLREALESDPDTLSTILEQVLELPEEQRTDLAKILRRTRLAAIINAAKTVVDRLDFIESLNELLFGDFKKTLLERDHLHRILAEEMWLFGEQYALGADEDSLKSLLAKHIGILGRDQLTPAESSRVSDLDGRERRVDLMVYGTYPHTPHEVEHLVIELKRPSVTIGQKEISQVENYAFTIADDERFDKHVTKWKFLLLGNDLSSFAEKKCSVQGRAFGHIHASEDGRLDIHVKTWSSVINAAKWRYKFFREKLQLQVSHADGLAYLRSRHSEHLPAQAEDAADSIEPAADEEE